MTLRTAQLLLVAGVALFYTPIVLNNTTDYGSNYEFVRHVMMMDSTFPENHAMWRAANSPSIHTAFYVGIIGWEAATMLLCWWEPCNCASAPWNGNSVRKGQAMGHRGTDAGPADVAGGVSQHRR